MTQPILSGFEILQGSYLQDLLAQPLAIADTITRLGTLGNLPSQASGYSRIVLTGMGSSLHALHPLLIQLVAANRTAMMVETAELINAQPQLLDGQTLLVAVSQSGRSAETVALLDQVFAKSDRPFVIGVTNTSDSPLATRSDFVVPLAAGVEFSVSCKTYLATLIALEWLGNALTGGDPARVIEELSPVSQIVDSYFGHANEFVPSLIERLQNVRHLFLTGRGASLAAVGTGALILKESTRFHAEGMSSPAFRHGPLEMVTPNLFALVFSGDPSTAALNERLADDIAAAGGRVALVGETGEPGVFQLPKVSKRLRPIIEMLPVQMMSLALAAMAGRTPGVFERASKITATA